MYVLVFCENAFPVCYSFIASEVTNIASEATDIASEVTGIASEVTGIALEVPILKSTC